MLECLLALCLFNPFSFITPKGIFVDHNGHNEIALSRVDAAFDRAGENYKDTWLPNYFWLMRQQARVVYLHYSVYDGHCLRAVRWGVVMHTPPPASISDVVIVVDPDSPTLDDDMYLGFARAMWMVYQADGPLVSLLPGCER